MIYVKNCEEANKYEILESNVWDKTIMANHTQFKSGNTFQTIQSSCSHQRIINKTDDLNKTSGLKRNKK